jgi:hypothetical protein
MCTVLLLHRPGHPWPLLLAAAPAAAQPPHAGGPGRGQGGGPGGPGRGGPPVAVTPLGPAYRPRIQSWYLSTPGYNARPLPPGIMRQLARGRPLPPGIARRAAPPGLLGLLPRYPGHSWYVIGTAVVLVDLATGVVRDLLLDALLR